MSVIQKNNQKNAGNNPSKEQRILVWKPNHSVPYVIHIPGREEREDLPFVCIWPKVIRHIKVNMKIDLLYYFLDREHICEVKLIQRGESTIVFDKDKHFSSIGHNGKDPITLSAITDEEFETVKRYYEKCGWKKLQTKEDLVRNYLDCLD